MLNISLPLKISLLDYVSKENINVRDLIKYHQVDQNEQIIDQDYVGCQQYS